MIFKAHKSGDYSSFCFDVDKETFKKIKGIEPDEFSKSFFFENKYRIYMEDLFKLMIPDLRDEEEVEVIIDIKKNIKKN